MAIQLKIDRVLQGSFELKALNLLFVFQVNRQTAELFRQIWFPIQNRAKPKVDRF